MLSRQLSYFFTFALGALLTCFAQASDLRVLPPEIVVSYDYPAQLVILQTSGDEAVDVTQSPNVRVTIEGIEGITLDNQRVMRLPNEVPSGRTGRAIVKLENDECVVPIRVAVGQHQSPIFPREVAGVLGKSGCNLGTCHGNLHGKAGFRLSLRGDDPALDYASIVRGAGGRRLDRFEATQSLLLRKPLGEVAHQGGVRLQADSVEARILTEWIKEGCQWNRKSGQTIPARESQTISTSTDETLLSLGVYPSSVLLSPSCRQQQLTVLATFGDGIVRDVTSVARFEPSVVTGVTMDAQARVVADRPMDVSISISYLTGRTACRVVFLAGNQPQWNESPATSRVDELVEGQLQRMHIRPAAAADSYTLVRRIYLATIGRLPTAAEVSDFCQSETVDAEAYERLMEKLLHDQGYARAWSMRWSDLLRNEQKVMSEKGAELWHTWMTEQIASDRPLGEFVAEMISTLGSTYEHPPAGFHRTHRDPETAAESIGQVFLGVRLQCARCHNHPFDKWRQDDYYGLAAYFTTLERKQLDNEPKDKFDKHIISGDELISYKEKARPTIWHPGRAAEVPPKPLTQSSSGAALDDAAEDAASDDAKPKPLEALARWLTLDNRLFARNMANRIWYHVMGVGIVDPPDDFRDSNPPSNPELLEYLTDELIRSHYSTRHLTRLILGSRTFQRQSVAEAPPEQPLGGARVFAGYPMRRMPAEVLYDAISDVTDVYAKPEHAKTIEQCRSMAQVNVPTKAGFLQTFGKPGRLLVCECERSSDASLGQSLVLVNGLETRDKIAAGQNRIGQLMEGTSSTSDKLRTLFLTTLARPPRSEEVDRLVDYVTTAQSSRSAWEDVLWALMNSKEFSLIR